MAEQVNVPAVSIALDMKKSRIRIHKPTVHMLGDLKLIQLLFDPEDMVVAIVCPEEVHQATAPFSSTTAVLYDIA